MERSELTGALRRVADDPDAVGQVLERQRVVRHIRVLLEQGELPGLGQPGEEVVAEVAPDRALERLAAGLLGRLGDVAVAGDPPLGARRLPTGAVGPRLAGPP